MEPSSGYSIKEVSAMENHAELVDGNLVVTDKTTVAHNNAVTEISIALKQFIRDNNGECKVFTENVALYCNELCNNDSNFFLPDVMSVCDTDGIKDDGIHTVPKFVAEITSAATRKYDYGKKMIVYGDIGVQEYWVVDLQRRVIVRYLQDNDFAPEIIAYSNVESISVKSFPHLEIPLANIFD
jgi:Uma2 family endonuclease